MAIFRQKKDHTGSLISVSAGLCLLIVGFINTFWGNDPFFGLGIVFISGLYLWPMVSNALIRFQAEWHKIIKVVLFLLILWAALGVGELGDKISLMREGFPLPNITGI